MRAHKAYLTAEQTVCASCEKELKVGNYSRVVCMLRLSEMPGACSGGELRCGRTTLIKSLGLITFAASFGSHGRRTPVTCLRHVTEAFCPRGKSSGLSGLFRRMLWPSLQYSLLCALLDRSPRIQQLKQTVYGS